MVATALRDVTKSQNIEDSATDEDVEEKAICDLIVHTLKRQGTCLRVQGEFQLPMRGTNVPSLVRTGAAVEKMRHSGHNDSNAKYMIILSIHDCIRSFCRSHRFRLEGYGGKKAILPH